MPSTAVQVEARQTSWLMQLIHALDDMVQEQLARSQQDQVSPVQTVTHMKLAKSYP